MKWLVSLALVVLLGTLSTLAMFWIARSDHLRWSVLTNNHFPIEDFPDGAEFGDIIVVNQGSEVSVFDPLEVCNISTDFELSNDPPDLVETRSSPTANLLVGNEIVLRQLNPINYVDQLRLADPRCESTIAEEGNGSCMILVASEMWVDGELIGLSTSTSCLLFDYQNMTSEEVHELTSTMDFSKAFGITAIERYLLFLNRFRQ